MMNPHANTISVITYCVNNYCPLSCHKHCSLSYFKTCLICMLPKFTFNTPIAVILSSIVSKCYDNRCTRNNEWGLKSYTCLEISTIGRT